VRPFACKALILERGTIRDAARACNMGSSLSPFTRIVNGYQEPWPALRRRVADYCGVTEAEAWTVARARARR
jgi:hypothetical protein